MTQQIVRVGKNKTIISSVFSCWLHLKSVYLVKSIMIEGEE